MKRTLVIAALLISLALAILLHTPIKDWLWIHPWWHSFFVTVPTIAATVLALLEFRHSAEANVLREEANALRRELGAERNKHLQQIADHVKPQLTQADRNATKLRKYIGQYAAVSEREGYQPSSLQIVEVSEDNIATLFFPALAAGSMAYFFQVHCNELEIVDMTNPLQLRF